MNEFEREQEEYMAPLRAAFAEVADRVDGLPEEAVRAMLEERGVRFGRARDGATSIWEDMLYYLDDKERLRRVDFDHGIAKCGFGAADDGALLRLADYPHVVLSAKIKERLSDFRDKDVVGRIREGVANATGRFGAMVRRILSALGVDKDPYDGQNPYESPKS